MRSIVKSMDEEVNKEVKSTVYFFPFVRSVPVPMQAPERSLFGLSSGPPGPSGGLGGPLSD